MFTHFFFRITDRRREGATLSIKSRNSANNIKEPLRAGRLNYHHKKVEKITDYKTGITKLAFLYRCREECVIQNFLKTQHHIQVIFARRILHRASVELLKERIKNHENSYIKRKKTYWLFIHTNLTAKLDENTWDVLSREIIVCQWQWSKHKTWEKN